MMFFEAHRGVTVVKKVDILVYFVCLVGSYSITINYYDESKNTAFDRLDYFIKRLFLYSFSKSENFFLYDNYQKVFPLGISLGYFPWVFQNCNQVVLKLTGQNCIAVSV